MNRRKVLVIAGCTSIVLSMINKPKFHQTSATDQSLSQLRQQQLSLDSISQGVKSIMNRGLLSNLPLSQCDKSEAVPAPVDSVNNTAGRVVEMTQETITNTVMSDDKDVFVVFYAPWCGYCKRLFPVWEALATATKLNDKVVIGQVDMTKHEITLSGVQIQGYPTIYYFPRGRLGRAIEYRNAREVVALSEFVQSCHYRQTAIDRGWCR